VQPNSDSSNRAQAVTGEQPAVDWLGQMPFTIPPLIQLAQETFEHDLAELLKEREGQWVAYHGDRQLGFGKSKTELYRECLRRGLPDDEFVVYGIEPDEGDIYLDHRPAI
jgi:hypothetical protein